MQDIRFSQRIQEAKEKRLKSLSLISTDLDILTCLPEELLELEFLEELNLSKNLLTSIPDSIARLRNLTSLNLTGNKLRLLPDSISTLPKLKSLILADNLLLTVPEWLPLLKNLELLDLSGRNLKTIPESILQSENLKHLILNYNQLSNIPDGISNLKKLEVLSLTHNDLRTLPDSIAELRELKKLILKGNLFSNIPDVVYELVSLRGLYLGEPMDRRSMAEFMLHRTVTPSNKIKKISPKILNLINLEELDLAWLHIETPPPKILNLDGNGLADIQRIKNYFRQLEEEGKDYLYEAKLLIVGARGAGKSTLAKKLMNPEYELQADEKLTRGIEVCQWQFPMENGQSFRVNIWDFGGQESYHATHQFFLTKRSLYALVVDMRTKYTDLEYWLNIVALLSDNSPLLVIKNEKQDHHDGLTESQLPGQFKNLKQTLVTNLATKRGLFEIVDEIKHYTSRLPHVGMSLPRAWVKAREALENDTRNYISVKEYLKICARYGFKHNRDKLQLSGYLHDLGVCLHFQNDPVLKNKVILKPKWGIDAVYRVLNNITVMAHRGRFNKSDLANIWHEEEYADMHGELLQLMINFKLCYQIKDSEYYIVPELLTETQPEYEWDEDDNLILRYSYEYFMPKGILTRFIAAMHTLIDDQKLVWKSGVILKKDGARAELIESYGKREINIRIAGKHKKELTAIVTHEMDEINASYKRLRYSKLIPCNCSACKDDQDPHFYNFEGLRQCFAIGRFRILCGKSHKMVEVIELLYDVMPLPRFLVEEIEEKKKRVEDSILQQKVDTVAIQQSEKGVNIVRDSNRTPVKSYWANDSLYLFTFAVVIIGLGVLVNTVSIYTLVAVLMAGIIFVPIIGAFQLKQDKRLSEKSFLELMRLVIRQLPLIGKLARQQKEP